MDDHSFFYSPMLIPNNIATMTSLRQPTAHQFLIALTFEIWRGMLKFPSCADTFANNLSVWGSTGGIPQHIESGQLTIKFSAKLLFKFPFAFHVQSAQEGPVAVDHKIGTF